MTWLSRPWATLCRIQFDEFIENWVQNPPTGTDMLRAA
jgi:hypothetical protein